MPVSLETLIARREVNTRVMVLIQQRAVPAIANMRAHGETGGISARSFVFSDDFRTLAIRPISGTHTTEQEAVAEFGQQLLRAIEASPHQPPRLVKIAQDCTDGKIRDLATLDLRLERRLSDTIYIPLIAIVLLLLLILYIFSH